MKKLFKKRLSTILTITIILSIGFSSFTAYAEEPAKLIEPLKDSQVSGFNKFSNPFSEDDCVDLKTADKGYIITILEEAFETDTTGKEDANANYKTRICTRNTFQIKDVATGKIITHSKLLHVCSPTAKGLSQDKTDPNYEIRFGCKEVLVILSKGGTTMIFGYIGMIYRWAARLVGLIAVLVIVLSGIQLSAAGGDQEAVNSAKKRIIQSISGIAVLFLSSLILNTINPNFYII